MTSYWILGIRDDVGSRMWGQHTLWEIVMEDPSFVWVLSTRSAYKRFFIFQSEQHCCPGNISHSLLQNCLYIHCLHFQDEEFAEWYVPVALPEVTGIQWSRFPLSFVYCNNSKNSNSNRHHYYYHPFTHIALLTFQSPFNSLLLCFFVSVLCTWGRQGRYDFWLFFFLQRRMLGNVLDIHPIVISGWKNVVIDSPLEHIQTLWNIPLLLRFPKS